MLIEQVIDSSGGGLLVCTIPLTCMHTGQWSIPGCSYTFCKQHDIHLSYFWFCLVQCDRIVYRTQPEINVATLYSFPVSI